MKPTTAPGAAWWVRTRHVARQAVDRVLTCAGYDLVRRQGPAPELPPDFDAATAATVRAVQGYTLTPPERVFMLCQSVRYVVKADLPGDLVECGVWRGGSSLAMVRTLLDLGVTDRDVWMYDTFDRMPDPGDVDVDFMGIPASENHAKFDGGADYDHDTYDYLPFAKVQALLTDTGYPAERLHFVRGLVEDTIPAQVPDTIALLRLDTDYYSSTAHELAHLYPRLSSGGVLLIDDYGHFQGCRQATDEYLATLAAGGHHVLLNRIDYSARLVVVPSHAPAPAGGGRLAVARP